MNRSPSPAGHVPQTARALRHRRAGIPTAGTSGGPGNPSRTSPIPGRTRRVPGAGQPGRLNRPGVFGGGGVPGAAATGVGRSCERGRQEARLGPRPAQRHILRLMPDRPPDAAWLKLGAEPGLCGACRHAKLNETRRVTACLRCTRAAWDIALSRYPHPPVTQCGGFERREGKP